MRIETFPTREAWRAARRLGIGGSDVPAILGLSPWRTPLQTWADKVGLADESADSYALRRGRYMERMMGGEIERAVEESVADNSIICAFQTASEFADFNAPFRGEDHAIVLGSEPWMRYSPDGFLRVRDRSVENSERVSLVEFKSHPRGASEWDESVPAHVVAQVQYGMHVCDLPAAYVAVDLGTEFRWAKVERDAAWWPTHEAALREFWRRVVEEDAPPPSGDEGDRAVLAMRYPAEQKGKTVALQVEMLDDIGRLDDLKRTRKTLDEEIAALENGVRAAMGDAEVAVLIDGSGFTLRTQARAEHVVTASVSRVLRRTARKER